MPKMKLVATSELLASLFITSVNDHEALEENPKAYIFNRTNVEFGPHIDIKVAKNTEWLMNLALPYYDSVSYPMPESLEDTDMHAYGSGWGQPTPRDGWPKAKHK